MLSDHLLIPNWHLPFRMLITRFVKLLKFDLSAKRDIAPSVDINSTLLKRMHVGERAPALAPQPPPIIPIVSPGSSSASVDPYPALSAQLREHNWRWLLILKRFNMDFRTTWLISIHPSVIFRHVSMRVTVGTLGLFLFRAATRSLFLFRVLHLLLGYLLQLLLKHQHLLKIQTFRKNEPLLCWWQKKENLSGVI